MASGKSIFSLLVILATVMVFCAAAAGAKAPPYNATAIAEGVLAFLNENGYTNLATAITDLDLTDEVEAALDASRRRSKPLVILAPNDEVLDAVPEGTCPLPATTIAMHLVLRGFFSGGPEKRRDTLTAVPVIFRPKISGEDKGLVEVLDGLGNVVTSGGISRDPVYKDRSWVYVYDIDTVLQYPTGSDCGGAEAR